MNVHDDPTLTLAQRGHLQRLAGDDATAETEWPTEIDEEVEVFVVHPHWRMTDPRNRDEQWTGWFRGCWTDVNGGGWVWDGMAGTIYFVRPIVD